MDSWTYDSIRHAGTPFMVSLDHREGVLALAVRDSASSLPSPLPVDPAADGGRGLVVVSALSDAWGVTPCRDGVKEVWARFTMQAG